MYHRLALISRVGILLGFLLEINFGKITLIFQRKFVHENKIPDTMDIFKSLVEGKYKVFFSNVYALKTKLVMSTLIYAVREAGSAKEK